MELLVLLLVLLGDLEGILHLLEVLDQLSVQGDVIAHRGGAVRLLRVQIAGQFILLVGSIVGLVLVNEDGVKIVGGVPIPAVQRGGGLVIGVRF